MTEIRLDYVRPVEWPDGGEPGPARAYARVLVDQRPLDLVLLFGAGQWQVLATPAAERDVTDHFLWPGERTVSLANGEQDVELTLDEMMKVLRLTIGTSSDELVELALLAPPPEPEPVTKLVYAEDLVPRMVIEYTPSRDGGGRSQVMLVSMFGDIHAEWCTIVEIRDYGHMRSAILRRPSGELVPGYYSPPELIRVRVD